MAALDSDLDSESGGRSMASYVAVSEAVRLAERKTTLLREVMKKRAQAASPVGAASPGGGRRRADLDSRLAGSELVPTLVYSTSRCPVPGRAGSTDKAGVGGRCPRAMSELAQMPKTRDEMIRAVCEANGGNQDTRKCVCIREGIEPCLPQADFADDVLRWIEEARKQERTAAREMLMPTLSRCELHIMCMHHELTAMGEWLEIEQ